MGRKGDGMPAWISPWIPPWRGIGKMQAPVKGVRLAQQVGSFG